MEFNFSSYSVHLNKLITNAFNEIKFWKFLYMVMETFMDFEIWDFVFFRFTWILLKAKLMHMTAFVCRLNFEYTISEN